MTKISDKHAEELFSELVKVKYEPFVCGAWVSKINHKGQEDSRYFVATYSQLYLCKSSMFGNSLKISRSYPWVKLESVSGDKKSKILNFKFQKAALTIKTDLILSVAKDLATLFYELFPEERRQSFLLPLKSDFEPPKTIPQTFIGLVRSFCIAMELFVSDTFYKKLSQLFKNKPNLVDFTPFSSDKKLCQALISAVELAQSIFSIKLPETKQTNIFKTLTTILNKNKNIAKITITNAKKWKHYDDFIDALIGSNVKQIYFESCTMKQDHLNKLIYCEHSKELTSIGFSECDIDEKKLNFIMKFSERLEAMQSFKLKNDLTAMTPAILSNFKTFVISNSITKLDLTNTNINIKDFFTVINGQETLLESITLKQNIFTSLIDPVTKKVQEFKLPPSLYKLDLSEVTWATDSLIYMISKQKFASQCHLDCSKISTYNDVDDFFSQLASVSPSPQPFAGFKWNDNILDPRLPVFLSKNQMLTEVDFDRVVYEEDLTVPILNSLVVMVQALSISHFSMCGFKKHSNTPLLVELLPVMQMGNSIKEINVSWNGLGNAGLEIFQRFIESSNQLEFIAFDGSLPSNLQTYINLLKSIAQLPNLTKVETPKADISLIFQAFPAAKAEIKNLWSDIRIRTNSNQIDIFPAGVEETLFYTSYPEITPSDETKTNEVEETLEANWTFQVKLPMIPSYKDWEMMSQKYSLRNLTSIDVK